MNFNRKKAALLTLMFFLVSVTIVPLQASAGQITSRSVSVANSTINATTSHRFDFTLPSAGTIGSISFEYCSNSPLILVACVAPVGFDASASTLTSQSGETGFTIDGATTANRILLTRPAGLNSAIPVSYVFGNVHNPSTPHQTVYVRISLYPTTDASGPFSDEGSVAFSATNNVTVSGYVPPFLIFCVGVTVAGDCSSSSGQQLNLGELRKDQPSFATSQFAGATNDPGGFNTFVNGLTMTSGSNTIPALSVPTGSIAGTSQFGMNLRANSNPGVGSDPSGVGTATPTANYNQPNLYTFNNELVTSSPLSTNFNLFTASYIVNISNGQAPGVYNTTLTYTAVAAF